MKKNAIKLNEGQFREFVTKLVTESLSEMEGTYYPMLGVVDTSSLEDVCQYAGEMEKAAAKFLHALIQSGYSEKNAHLANTVISQWKKFQANLTKIKSDCAK